MRTSKPFATIDYNSDEFLKLKLDELIRARKIDFYAFINHLPEEDEEKPHKHLYIVPSSLFDTNSLIDYLAEIDLSKSLKPFTCIAPRSSKFDDWYLYSLHDVRYLASKGQSRKYHYKPEEVISSDKDYLSELVHQIDYSKLYRLDSVQRAVAAGVPFTELVANGVVPIQQINQYEKAYSLIRENTLERSGRLSHTPKSFITDQNGEIYEEADDEVNKAF